MFEKNTQCKILVVDSFGKAFFSKLAKECGDYMQRSELDDLAFLYDPNFLVVRSKTKVDRAVIDRMPNLKGVVSPTHGRDHVDVAYLKKRGIEFCNIPVQAYDVAQGVMGYVYGFATRLVEGDRSMKGGKWEKKDSIGFRLSEMTLGIIGYGQIGGQVYKLANANNMSTIIYDKYVARSEPLVENTPDGFDRLLRESDIITVHVPLTADTKVLLGESEIEKMKSGVYIINTSRGGVVDEAALLEGLKSGKVAGAALDVYSCEPPFGNAICEELIKLDNVIATPHSIGQTVEAIGKGEIIGEKGTAVINCIKNWQEKIYGASEEHE
jgi:phosphoglycerate dehydrogenase-like enzyme